MTQHRYYPELHNPQLHPSAEPFIDVRFHYDTEQPEYSFYEIVETSGPVYVGDKDRFIFSSTTFGNVQSTLQYAESLATNYAIYYSVH